MKNSKEWWSVSELLDKELETLPKTDKGISKKADRENWEKRQRSGVKGKTFEYHYSSFPEDVQRALGFSIAFPTTPHSRDDFVISTPSG
ncbi:TPA: DNA-binding protein, partial [Pasteurella multocida]